MDSANKYYRKCESPDHEFKDCSKKISTNPYRSLYECFKLEQYRPSRSHILTHIYNNKSYTEAAYSKPPTHNKSLSNNIQNKSTSFPKNSEVIPILIKKV